MKHTTAILVGTLFCVSAFAQTSAPLARAADWSFWIEQNGTIQKGPDFRLKKAPFTVNFKGLPNNDYGLTATPNKSELPSGAKLDTLFRVGNGLLIDDPNTKITINESGSIQKESSSWNLWAYHTPAETDMISGFQQKAVHADGTKTFARLINQLCLDDGVKDLCKPVGTPVVNKFYLVVTRIPHLVNNESIENTRWLEPKSATVEFE